MFGSWPRSDGARERGDVTVVCVFDIVNLAVEPLGIDSLM